MAEKDATAYTFQGVDLGQLGKEGPSLLRRFFTKKNLTGYLFISPWLIGFVVFTAGPFFASMWLSLNHWDLFNPPKWVGLGNFRWLFFEEPLFRVSLFNTAYYVLFHVPGIQVIALGLALLLNQKLRGIAIYRTIFYLPSVTAGVATAFLWAILLTNDGLINTFLSLFGIKGPAWLNNLTWAMPALVLMSFWSPGGAMIIYLAGLQGVPQHLYEAAEVDGANFWSKFWNVTIPLLTPTIFYNLVMGIIGSFQVFTAAFIMTGGGPANRTLFYMLHLYWKAFAEFKMGHAAAMAWILFAIIMVFTLLQLALARRWVYYEAGGGRGVI